MATVDMELRKHFEELQIQMAETRSKMRSMDTQVETLKKVGQHASLTKKEVSSISDQKVKTYESCGRMFVLRTQNQINEMLDDKIKSSEEKIKSLQANKEYLEKSLKERENNLRELIIQKQQKPSGDK